MMKISNIKRYFKEKISLNRIKLTAIVVSILLLAAFALPVFGGIASAQNYPVLSGTTYLNMPEKTFGGKTTTCKLTVTNFNLNKNEFTLKGILSYSNRNYPLSIQGTLYKSRIGKDNFVALAKDTTNNFNILHFSILFNPNKHFLVTKKAKDIVSKQSSLKGNNSSPIITLYLQRKNSREISFVEGKASGVYINSINEHIHDYHYGSVTTETYLYLIFKPTYSDVAYKKPIENTTNASTSDTTDAVFYRRFYNSTANQYTVYEIDIRAQELWTGNRAQVETKLTITNATTSILDGNTLQVISSWQGTPYTLGSYSEPVTSKIVAEYGNAFTNVTWNGNYHTKPYVIVKFDAGLHLDLLFVSVGLDATTNNSYKTINGRYFTPGFNPFKWGSSEYSNDWTRSANIPLLYTCLKADSNAQSQYYELDYNNHIVGGNGRVEVNWNVPVFYYQYPGEFFFDQTLTLYNTMGG